MNINIAICDDNKTDIQQLCKHLHTADIWKNHSYKTHTYLTGERLLAAIGQKIKFDIIFLDIRLNDETLGTDIGRKLKSQNPNLLLIYTSSYDYYREVAQAEPFAFLNKPIMQDVFEHVLQRAIKRLLYIKPYFYYSYSFNGVLNTINLKDVIYFESQHRIINIYCADNSVHQFYDKMDNVEKDLEEKYPYFIRVSKSYYVNYKYVSSITNHAVSVKGLTFKISSKYKTAVADKLRQIFD